jgi:hypothetical protein
MSLVRHRIGRRVPTLTEVIAPPTTVDLLLDVPSEWPDSQVEPDGAPSSFEVQRDPAETLGLPFTGATVPSVGALLAPVDDAVRVEAPVQDPAALDRVLTDLERQLEAALDAKLREALAPVLARAAESVIRETREQLATTLREVIESAVAQELARQRER